MFWHVILYSDTILMYLCDFASLLAQMVKRLPCNVVDLGSIPGLGRYPGEGWQPTPVLLPEKSHGQRSLVGYTPWGRKESDTTEQLHFTYSCVFIGKGYLGWKQQDNETQENYYTTWPTVSGFRVMELCFWVVSWLS